MEFLIRFTNALIALVLIALSTNLVCESSQYYFLVSQSIGEPRYVLPTSQNVNNVQNLFEHLPLPSTANEVQTTTPVTSDLEQQTCDAVVNYCARVDKFPCLSDTLTTIKCIDREQVCNYVRDCDDGSDEYRCPTMCSVHDLAAHDIGTHCGWRQDNADVSDGLHWVVMAAYETISGVRISPNKDSLGHTCGKFFALADHYDNGPLKSLRSHHQPTQFARPVILHSALFSSAAASCTFSFAFTMYDNRARYYLYANYENAARKSNILWMTQFAGNYSWQSVRVSIGEQSEPFRLSFLRAPAPHSTHGTIVLDAFSFDQC